MTMVTAPSVLLLVQAIATGSITGTLRDAASADVLSGVVVSVVDLNRTVITDVEGRYRLERLPSGTHRLLARRIGYAPRTIDVLVPLDATIEIGIVLRAEPITLSAVGGSDISESFVPDRHVDMAQAREHPWLAEPDAFQALSGGTVALQPESPTGIHVRGGASDQLTYLLDGFPVFSPYHSGESFSAWNPDALESVALETASETWDGLSGVVAAMTRTPRAQHHAQAGLSTTQLRFALDGPLGSSGAGYLWSQRSGFPGFPAPQQEATYLRGETGDQLGKIEAAFAGGHLQLLGYTSGSELDTQGPTTGASRNTFAWQSSTIGAAWRRPLGASFLDARLWIAGQNASATWMLDSSAAERLASYRRDAGLTVMLEQGDRQGRSAIGVRAQASRMAYDLSVDSGGALRYASAAPLLALFLERNQRLSTRLELQSTLGATTSARATRLSPRLSLSWSPGGTLVLTGGYLQLHQFAQSLRNPESVAGTVFPVDLFVGATRSGVPIARSDEGIVAAQYRPMSSIRLAGQAYVRSFHDIVLVAPRNHTPFSAAPFTIGSGRARGFALELARTTARYSLAASYGRQGIRFAYQGTSYVPDYATTDLVDAGVTVSASKTVAIRAAASGRFGRRVTALVTPFEWESCNVADRGCEFAGSPQTADSLGATRVPGYLRFDLGIRTHWSFQVAGRTTDLAVFGTVTNVFGRTNVLTIAPDPITGTRTPVTLRSRVPLVVGIDWAF